MIVKVAEEVVRPLPIGHFLAIEGDPATLTAT
jgi:hypothetical protein